VNIDWNLVFSGLLVLITFLIYKLNERLTWFTGAMESHSDLMLRIEAYRGINGKRIDLVWWDPSLGAPPIKREHGQPVQLERIYCFLPERERQFRPTWWDRLVDTLFGGSPL